MIVVAGPPGSGRSQGFPLREIGEVFINADEVEPYKDVHNFPAEMKANKESFPLTFGVNRD